MTMTTNDKRKKAEEAEDPTPAPGNGGGDGADGEMLDWAVWQLIDPLLPTGGFAHSQGLEAAAQGGLVAGADDRSGRGNDNGEEYTRRTRAGGSEREGRGTRQRLFRRVGCARTVCAYVNTCVSLREELLTFLIVMG